MSAVLPVNAGTVIPTAARCVGAQPVETVQSRFGMGRSAKAQPVVPVRSARQQLIVSAAQDDPAGVDTAWAMLFGMEKSAERWGGWLGRRVVVGAVEAAAEAGRL